MMALINDMKSDKNHPGQPKIVVSNNTKANGLVFAEKNSIETFAYNIEKIEDNLIFEEKTLQVLKEKNIDIICLAGFMKILSEKFIKSFSKPILNIHPSLLPSFKGLNTHQRALENKEKYSGCTVHFVNAKLDSGKIILQKKVKILKKDTLDKLAKRILAEEHKLYPKAILKIFSL